MSSSFRLVYLIGLWFRWADWPTIVLQCFDTVGWVIWPVKIVPDMTYNVFGGTLNPTLLLWQAHHWRMWTMYQYSCSWHSADGERGEQSSYGDTCRCQTSRGRRGHAGHWVPRGVWRPGSRLWYQWVFTSTSFTVLQLVLCLSVIAVIQ